jgi:hypothetical protein
MADSQINPESEPKAQTAPALGSSPKPPPLPLVSPRPEQELSISEYKRLKAEGRFPDTSPAASANISTEITDGPSLASPAITQRKVTASPVAAVTPRRSNPATASSATVPPEPVWSPATGSLELDSKVVKPLRKRKQESLFTLLAVAVRGIRESLLRLFTTEVLRSRLREIRGYAVSFSLHILVLLLLSLAIIPQKEREDFFDTIVAVVDPAPVADKIDETLLISETPGIEPDGGPTEEINSEIVSDMPGAIDMDISDFAPAMESLNVPDAPGVKLPEGDLAGRTKQGRSKLVHSQGGTPASESAVDAGLKWLAKHQRPDGSWSFQHGTDDPGNLDNPMGATGMALLAFLGAGNTHKVGDFKKEVGSGLKYLTKQMKSSGAGGDLRGPRGTMYTQGICAIALCEAYAISKDKELKQPTQQAITFIANAQDSKKGGWRYQPGQPGDTSAVGWQIMALKSAKIARLNVPSKTIAKATAFLNSVQSNGGANYGYLGPADGGGATTAVGLLCRMYLGWTPKQTGLIKGVEFIGAAGPQPANMYFNYYGTQVMHHWGGEPWTKWNNVMRNYLVESQEKEGEARGSWKPTGGADHGDAAGGRHYRTCMSIMTLEVYYRHLPLYQRESIKSDFGDVP